MEERKGFREKSDIQVSGEGSWFCRACDEERVSDMRLCNRCKTWYHEDCVGLTKQDKDVFFCQECE
nr:unnamed protein product [Callosobruchus analis]